MKKIIIIAALLVLASNIFSQFQYLDIGLTILKDSTNYLAVNRSVLVNQNLFVRGYINLDSLAKGKIYYVGNELTFEQSKNGGFTFTNNGENAGFNINLGEKNSFFTITKLSSGVGIPIITIDSTGVNIESGMTYKIGGVPITAGTTNLYGYMHKDTAFIHNQHLRTKTFTIWAGSTDSVRFTVKGTVGDLMVTPVGDNITFGSSFGTGTKNVYAGAYYVGDTILTSKTLTWDKRSYHTAVDSSIILKGLKGLTGETMLRLSSPGNGHQGIGIYNSTTSNSIYFYTSNGVALYTMDNNGFWLGDGTTGKPFLTQGAPTTSAVSYTFYGDLNTGLLRNSADNISLVTGGTSRFTTSTTSNTSTLPLIISGVTSYVTFPSLTSTERDALTPAAGMVVFNTTATKLQVYAGGTWVDLH